VSFFCVLTNIRASRKKVLAEQRCSQCHGVKRGEKSPDAAVPSFSDVADEPSLTEYTLRVFLKTPHPTMPNLIIKPDEMDDIVSYIVFAEAEALMVWGSGYVDLASAQTLRIARSELRIARSELRLWRSRKAKPVSIRAARQ
jgi:hypothetical protein